MNIPLLSQICEIPGTSGFEDRIRQFVLSQLDGLADSVSVDNMGNVTALVKGRDSSRTVMSAAHMDEIGFIVQHIDDKGFIRFLPLGGHDPKTLTSQRVIVHGKKDVVGVMGCKPIHLMSAAERGKSPELKDYFIDLGMPADEVKKLVEIGNPITRERGLIEMGDCVNVKSLDNRVSVYILLETLKKLKQLDLKPAYDFAAVFTVQEEVGLRGANVSALSVKPDFGIALDITIAFDVPGAAPQDMVTELGKGTAIKILDSSVICDHRMVSYLKYLATTNNIPWQPELLSGGGTDTAGLQRMVPGGSIAGAISIPTRNVHQVIEMCHKVDIQASIDLMTVAVAELDSWDWSFGASVNPLGGKSAKPAKAAKAAKAEKPAKAEKKVEKKAGKPGKK